MVYGFPYFQTRRWVFFQKEGRMMWIRPREYYLLFYFILLFIDNLIGTILDLWFIIVNIVIFSNYSKYQFRFFSIKFLSSMRVLNGLQVLISLYKHRNPTSLFYNKLIYWFQALYFVIFVYPYYNVFYSHLFILSILSCIHKTIRSINILVDCTFFIEGVNCSKQAF